MRSYPGERVVNHLGSFQEELRAAWDSGEKTIVADMLEPVRPELAERLRWAQAQPCNASDQIRRLERNSELEIAAEGHADAWWTRALLDWDWEDGFVERLEGTLLGWQRFLSRPSVDPSLCFWKEGRIRIGQGEEATAGELIQRLPQWQSLTIQTTARVNVGLLIHHLENHRIRELGLAGVEIEGGALRSLETTGRMVDLEKLDVSYCPTLGDRALRDLATFGAQNLTSLDLARSNITRHGLSVLLMSDRLPKMKSLAVDFAEEVPHPNGSQELVHALTHSPWLGQLTDIALCGLRMETYDWDQLSDMDFWDQLRSVRLARSRPSKRLLKRILQNPYLEELDLAENGLKATDILDIAAWGKPPGLKRLRLDSNHIGDKATISLAKMGWFSSLDNLEIRFAGLGRPALVRVARELSTGNPNYVAITGNFLGDVSLPAFFGDLGPCDEIDLGNLSLDEPMAQVLRKHLGKGTRSLLAGQPVPGLELANIWKNPGKLLGMQTLGLAGGSQNDPLDIKDLRTLLKDWPGQGLTRIVGPDGTITRRRVMTQ